MARRAAPTTEPRSVQVKTWRIYTKEELLAYVEKLQAKYSTSAKRGKGKKRGDILAIRDKISTVDMYCYLKARFGEPNGFQTFLAKDDSDNWIHWDYNLKAGCADLHISGDVPGNPHHDFREPIRRAMARSRRQHQSGLRARRAREVERVEVPRKVGGLSRTSLSRLRTHAPVNTPSSPIFSPTSRDIFP